MPDNVSIRIAEGGEVTIAALGDYSYSHVAITEDYTTFSIKGTVLRCGYHDMRLQVDGKTVYEGSW